MTRIASLALSLLVTSAVTTTCTHGFALPRQHRRPKPRHRTTTSTVASSSSSSSTALRAVGVFVRKAKEAEVRKYCEEGPSDSVLAVLDRIKGRRQAASSTSSTSSTTTATTATTTATTTPGPLQSSLTKRSGTVAIIAEYKRNLVGSSYLTEIPPPSILSPVFREFGASAAAVHADATFGGCTYDDLHDVIREQKEAGGEVPGPLPVIASDVIVDEIQIARAKDAGADGVVVAYNVVGEEKVRMFLKDAEAVGLETIVNVGTAEEAQGAVDAGASIVSVCGVDGAESKYQVIESLVVPEGRSVCTVANILARGNKALEEVEEAWMCRDMGFNCVWVSDALYKSGNDPVEHPGAIINSMRAKSSVKYASPKARSGKGEGAKEYLGDLLM